MIQISALCNLCPIGSRIKCCNCLVVYTRNKSVRLIQVERQKSEQCQCLIGKFAQKMDEDGRMLPVLPALWAVSILSVVPAPAASPWQPVPAADPCFMPCSRVACKISRGLESCRCRTRTRQKSLEDVFLLCCKPVWPFSSHFSYVLSLQKGSGATVHFQVFFITWQKLLFHSH